MNSKKLSISEVFALSIAAVAPSGAMAFNTTTAATFAGINIPISFILGSLAMLLVGFCFVQMSSRISSEGSVYAYNSAALGEKWGFVSGWALALTYLCFSGGTAGLTADFGNVFLQHFGISLPIPVLAIFFILLVWFISFFGLKLTSRVALAMELVSILILIFLSTLIIVKGGRSGINAAPFVPTGNATGIGQGMIFAILCFAGFEGSSAFAVQAKKPKKAVPFAILATVIGAAIFYVYVSYAQVIGFGESNIKELATSSAPLDTLATMYSGNVMATIIDFATLMSCFAALLGALNACAYIIFALSNEGYLPKYLTNSSTKLNSPKNAVHTVSIICLILYVLIGLPFGPEQLYSNLATIGTLSLLIVYMLVCWGTLKYFKNKENGEFSIVKHVVIPILGIIVLAFPFWSNLYPIPSFPLNLYPYFVVLWLAGGYFMAYRREKKLKENPEPVSKATAN